MGYKIGSFNLKNLGMTSLGKENSRNLKAIAEIIKKEQFDVVALQEVLSEGKAFTSPDSQQTKRSILMELGSDWDFEWAEAETEMHDPRHEGYAFLWNKRRLQLSRTRLFDNTERIFYPRICRLNRVEMMRKPFYARFTPINGPYTELRLLCVHTFFGKDTALDRAVRQHELDTLMTDIYPQIADRIYSDCRPHYTILMGDYNVELWRSWKDDIRETENAKRILEGKARLRKPAVLNADLEDMVESTKWGNRRIKTVQDQFTTLKSIDTEDDSERGYAHDYDHFSYEESQFEGVKINVRRIDAVRQYYHDDFAKYATEISDHIPIMMEITLK